MDEKIIHWYGQNVSVNHPKVSPLPIGLENMHHYNHGMISHFKKIQAEKITKKDKILFGFTIGTNPTERSKAFSVLNETNVAEKIPDGMNAKKYLSSLNQYKFVASPEGNGIDCHRTWEATYTRTIPIVTDSLLTRYFFNLGLPLFIIKDWSEVARFDEKKLSEMYQSLEKRFDAEPLYFNYWRDSIKSSR